LNIIVKHNILTILNR